MEIASCKKAEAMEKLDNICGQQISLETSTQKLFFWSKHMARKRAVLQEKK